MGILMLLVYLAMLASSSGGELLQMLLQSDSSEWFAFWFGSVSGVVGMIALFVFCNTKVQYSPEGLIFKYPLRKKQELPWNQIQRIETVLERKQGSMTWKRLQFYSKEGTYKINMRCMTYGKDGFMTQFMAAVQKYKIPCVSARK